MKVLLWHGYLMSGTGSNIYTANVARRWKQRGHDVVVMCQEPHPERFDFVDSFETLSTDKESRHLAGTGSVAGSVGRCRVVQPDIGDILPVYVLDAYEGTQARLFVDLSTDELSHYTDSNVDALAIVIEDFEPDAIITGHEVMGPYIAREACTRTRSQYVAKLHGSALEYAVKLQDRYRQFAIDGLTAAEYVVGGSQYMIDAASEVLPGWEDKARVINPGCDIELFRPVDRDPRRKLRIGYVGKLIASKGVDHLLAAIPALRGEFDVVIVGFGGDEGQLRDLWDALRNGDRAGALRIACQGDIGQHVALPEFIDRQPQSYFDRAEQIDLQFPGRLDHGPLSKVLPTFDVLVAPSVVAEAFGMVAAEAAACGVLPVVPRHSGIGEAGGVLESALGMEGQLTFDPADPVAGIERAVNGLLAMSEAQRSEKANSAVAVARELWSWDVVATKLLDLASA